jgi:hypothetical protein
MGGLILGSAMLLNGPLIDGTISAAFFYRIHWPVLSLLQHTPGFDDGCAIILGFWIVLGVAAGLLVALLGTKFARSGKMAGCLILLASFPLGLFSFLLSSRIQHGGVLSIFPDALFPTLTTACVVLTFFAVGYTVFIVARAFYSGSNEASHWFIICFCWVLGTFALHCWVLSALAGMPSWASAKRDSEEQTMVLNSLITGYAGTLEDRARARAAMQMPMSRGGLTNPSIEQKLAMALRIEENAQGYLRTMANRADNATRQVARRSWISWAVIAFVPVILFALATWKRGRKTHTVNSTAVPPAGMDQ